MPRPNKGSCHFNDALDESAVYRRARLSRPYGGCIMLYYLKKPFLTVSKISSAFLPQVSSIFRQ